MFQTFQLPGKIDPEILCPWESGKQFLSLPESEVLSRIMRNNIEEKSAKALYISFWKIFVDARTKERNAKLKAKVKRRPKVTVQIDGVTQFESCGGNPNFKGH